MARRERRWNLDARARARKWCAIVAVGAMSLAAGVLTASAGATTSGQIGETWGSPGTGAGQFFNPAMLGVNPSDGSVYTGDVTSDGKHYRIQKFSGSGEFEASVEIPRIVEEKIVTLHGIAVDPALHRPWHRTRPPGRGSVAAPSGGRRNPLHPADDRRRPEQP
jgi:hypothetical protein